MDPEIMQDSSAPSRTIVTAALAGVVLVAIFYWFRPPEARRTAVAWNRLAAAAAEALGDRAAGARLDDRLDPAFSEAFGRLARRKPDAAGGPRIAPVRTPIPEHVAVEIDGAPPIRHPIRDAESLLPTLLAIGAALVFRRTLLPLLAGIAAGALLLEGFDPFRAGRRVVVYVYESATSQFYLSLIIFVLALIGMIAIGIRSGGVRGLVDAILRRIRTARGVRATSPLLGFAIFFDDYSNTVVIGNALRPLTDRLRIPREKLAFIIDSTAAPLAGFMFFSTWIYFEVGQIGAPLMALGAIAKESEAYGVFLASMPFRFYCILMLAFVLLNGLLARDFGPMLTAERRAADTGHLVRPGGRPMIGKGIGALQAKAGVTCRWWNIGIPLILTVLGVLLGLILSLDLGLVLATSALLGAVVAGALAILQRLLTPGETLLAFGTGIKTAGFALTILFAAWALGHVARDLGTAEYIIAGLDTGAWPVVLPLALFGIGAAISFATGSSFSTMGILLPLAVPIAWSFDPNPEAAMAFTVIAIAAVLDGSIFGDHCSPLSDTTVLSSIAAGSDHLDHVRTQLPYSMVAMTVAVGVGYAGALNGISPWLLLPVCLAILFAVLRFAGRPVSAHTSLD